MKSILILLILVVAISAPSLCSAEFYQYTDKNGVICFTDNPADVPEGQQLDVHCHNGQDEQQKDMQWESSSFYQMADTLSKRNLRSIDGVFDCEDWVVFYLIYKERFCNVEEPLVVFVFRRSDPVGHALAILKEANKYIICDTQLATFVERDTLEEAEAAAIGLWISLFKIDVPDHSDFYTLVATLDEVLKRMYR